jgi:hypothetical protein
LADLQNTLWATAPKTLETEWIGENEVRLPLLLQFSFMEIESKARFNLVFNVLIVKKEKI